MVKCYFELNTRSYSRSIVSCKLGIYGIDHKRKKTQICVPELRKVAKNLDRKEASKNHIPGHQDRA